MTLAELSEPVARAVALFTADQIGGLPVHPVLASGLVEAVDLWHSGPSRAGMMAFAPGAQLHLHRHLDGDHHVWVVNGAVTVMEHRLGAGGYVHVPAGVDHSLIADAAHGARIFYVFEGTRA